jgi:hypothetical protein
MGDEWLSRAGIMSLWMRVDCITGSGISGRRREDGRLVITLSYNVDDGKDHTEYVKKYGIRLYTGIELGILEQR